MKRTAKLGAETARRSKALGDIGERLAERVLRRAGFKAVRNLNHLKGNSPYADFLAEEGGARYAISVKIRNKYEYTHDGSQRLNGRYKLGAKCHEHARAAARKFRAKAAWLAISFEPRSYAAYFGLFAELRGNLAIPMSAMAKTSYRCLANNAPHRMNYAKLKNVYEVARGERRISPNCRIQLASGRRSGSAAQS